MDLVAADIAVAPAQSTTAAPSPSFDLAGALVAHLAVQLARGLREVAMCGAIGDTTQARGAALLKQLFSLRQESTDAAAFDRSARAHGAELMRACMRTDVSDQTINELVQEVFALLARVRRTVVN